MTLKNLCDYYVDCLKNDSINVIFSKKDVGHYCLTLNETGLSQSYSLLDKEYQEYIRFNYGKESYLGFPCYIGNNDKIAPLFIFKTQFDNQSSLSVNIDTFLFNNGALSDLNVFSEMPRQFIEKITSMDTFPSDFFGCREKLLPFSLSVDWIDKGIQQNAGYNAIVNQPILFRADALLATYSRGLKKELSELSEVDSGRLSKTALSKILDFSEPQKKKESETTETFEVLQLNIEQEQAILDALHNDVSVITGPPGTGKSQIIASFVINACLNGKTVLIASKNNKAVDVVEDRINALADRPFVMRQGGHYLQELNDYFGSLLQSVPTNQDYEEYEQLRAEYLHLTERIKEQNVLIRTTIDIRNILDKEEQEICGLRNNKTLYDYVSNRFDSNELESNKKTISSLVNTLDINKSVLKRLTFRVFRKTKSKKYSVLVKELKDYCNNLGLSFDKEKIEYSLEHITYYREMENKYCQLVKDCNQLYEYFLHLDRLSNMPGLPSIYVDIGKLKKERVELARKMWNKYLLVHYGNIDTIQRCRIVDAKAEITEAIATGAYSVPFSSIVPVREFMPCWAVTSLSAYGRIPLKPGYFDYVIIDEASQCDIPSALPLLYRAKKAIIVGDPNQLKHISVIKPNVNGILMKRHSIEKARFSYLSSSLYDLASSVQTPFMIRNHYRCHPDIVSFSNNYFYRNELRVATDVGKVNFLAGYMPGIEWIDVEGKTEHPRSGSAYNVQEADRVVEVLEDIVKSGYKGTIGVVSPFRAQINLIQKLVLNNEQISNAIERNEIVVDTAHKFQGDEKDVIVFSTVIAHGVPDSCLKFLNEQKNVFNVAITRARANLLIVGSLNYCGKTDVNFIREFASFVTRPIKQQTKLNISNVSGDIVSLLEKNFDKQLQEAGIKANAQYSACHYLLDFAIIFDDKKLDIEIDGEMYHKEWNGETIIQDIIRDNILEVNGWEIMRFWSYEVLDRPKECIKKVLNWVND